MECAFLREERSYSAVFGYALVFLSMRCTRTKVCLVKIVRLFCFVGGEKLGGRCC
jgi:hypothetical protein